MARGAPYCRVSVTTEQDFLFMNICNCHRWSMSWGTLRTSWCLHTTSTKWLDSSRIQEPLRSSWPNSWRAKVRGFIPHKEFTLRNVWNSPVEWFSIFMYYHVNSFGMLIACKTQSLSLSLLPMVVRWLWSMLMSMLSAVLFGKWTDHVKSWRHTELGDRIMYITYEEMVQVKLKETGFSTFCSSALILCFSLC